MKVPEKTLVVIKETVNHVQLTNFSRSLFLPFSISLFLYADLDALLDRSDIIAKWRRRQKSAAEGRYVFELLIFYPFIAFPLLSPLSLSESLSLSFTPPPLPFSLSAFLSLPPRGGGHHLQCQS